MMLRIYQALVSPLLGQRCRFYPSCSSYCIESLQKYRLPTAISKTAARLLRCHPANVGGVDFP